MRPVIVSLSFAALLVGCSREPNSALETASQTEPETQATAAEQAPHASAAPAPRIGGAVVATGEYAIEVAAHADGAIDAVVMTAAGEPVAHGDVSALEVTAQVEGQGRQAVALGWDAPRGRFRGTAQAGARLASGPLDVAHSIRGEQQKGHLELAVVLPRPNFGGHMMVVGSHSAEVVPKVDGEIEVHIRNAAGALVDGNAGLEWKLQVRGKGGAMHPVALRWDAPSASFEGRLEGDAQLGAGPIELAAIAGEAQSLGRFETAALIAPPSFGGTVIAAGDYSIEVVPRASGELEAVVRNAAGAAVEGGVELKAHVQAGGELRPVELAWDPARLRFAGKLAGDFELEPGPIDISVVANGRLHQGAIVAAAVLPSLEVDADAQLAGEAKAGVAAKAKAKTGAKAKLAARLKAEAAAAKKARADAKAALAAKSGASAKLKVKKPTASGSATASGAAKQQAGAKVGGSLGGGLNTSASGGIRLGTQ